MTPEDDLIELDLDDGPRHVATDIEERIELDIADRDSPCVDCQRVCPVDSRGRCVNCHDAMMVAREEREQVEQSETDAMLGDIAAQSSADANALNLGTVANGRATLGVGFRNADGYIEALKRGVAPATLREYTEILRSTYKRKVSHVTGDGVYTVTLDGETFSAPLLIMSAAVEAYVPVDNSEGIALLKARTAAKKAAKKQAKAEQAKGNTTIVPSEEQAERVPLVHGKLVAGAAAEGHGVLIGWSGAGDMTRAQMMERIALAGLPAEWAFDAKEPAVQLTRAVRHAAETLYNVEQEKKKEQQVEEAREWASRWMLVTRVAEGAAGESRVGQKYGQIALCVTLYTDKPTPELVFDDGADAQLVEKVRTEFEARIGAERYVASDVTKWLQVTLKTKCGAVKYGGNWYVPKKHRAVAESIVTQFKTWGADWMEPPLPIATSAQLAQGLANGLKREVDDELGRLEAQRKERRRQKQDEDADIGETAAQSFMTKLRGVLARVAAYEQLLGAECVAECKARVSAAMVEVSKSLDEETIAINERFSHIWDEIKHDLNKQGEEL